MQKDRLTSKERMDYLNLGKKIDRVPFISSATMYAGNIYGLSSQEFFLDPLKSFTAQNLCCEFHNCDGSPGFDLPGWIGLDFGGDLVFNNKNLDIPKLKPIIQDISDLNKLSIPNFDKALAFQKRLEFYKISNANNLSISIPAGSPLEVVAQIVEPTLLMKLLYKEPNLVHELLNMATNYLLEIADYYIKEFGAEKCSASSNYPLESNSLMSPKFFEKFSFPYIIDIHERFKEKGIKNYSLHLCGNHKNNLKYFSQLDLPSRTFISVDENCDIEHVSKTLRDDFILGGNVSTSILINGTYDDVFINSRDIIKKMKYFQGGFVLMPSCGLPINTPPLNVYAMLQATREFGKY